MEFHKGQGMAHRLPSYSNTYLLVPYRCSFGECWGRRDADVVMFSNEPDSPSNVCEQCNRKGKHWQRVLVVTSRSRWKRERLRARGLKSKQVGRQSDLRKSTELIPRILPLLSLVINEDINLELLELLELYCELLIARFGLLDQK